MRGDRIEKIRQPLATRERVKGGMLGHDRRCLFFCRLKKEMLDICMWGAGLFAHGLLIRNCPCYIFSGHAWWSAVVESPFLSWFCGSVEAICKGWFCLSSLWRLKRTVLGWWWLGVGRTSVAFLFSHPSMTVDLMFGGLRSPLTNLLLHLPHIRLGKIFQQLGVHIQLLFPASFPRANFS